MYGGGGGGGDTLFHVTQSGRQTGEKDKRRSVSHDMFSNIYIRSLFFFFHENLNTWGVISS